MKLQNMAVVFIIIILPVTLILSAYIQSQIDTAQLLLSYDTKLLDAAHDAMRAFELNTTNDDFATIGDSKRRDVEASITTFTNNLATNMGVGGYSKKYIEPYLPAVLFTLYDGYYIYTPTPYVKGEEVKQADGSTKIEYSNNGNEIYENVLKPYVYYSARFQKSDIDVVVNYSLDNYVSICGKVGAQDVHISGYFYSSTSAINSLNGAEEDLSENLFILGEGNKIFSYRKNTLSGKKEYWDPVQNRYFYYNDGTKTYLYGPNDATKTLDQNATEYKNNATTLLNDITTKYHLNTLKASDIIDQNGTRPYAGTAFGNSSAFAGNVDDQNSDFNAVRKQVIKDSIQTNLNAAITSYSNHSQSSGSTYNFKMPLLKDSEWEELLNNVSIVAFLQGLPAGTKVYNNYAIAISSQNSEYIDPNMIFLIDKNNVYHRPGCTKLTDSTLSTKPAYRSIEFNMNTVSTDTESYHFVRQMAGAGQPYTACYDCIVSANHLVSLENISGKPNVMRRFYQALIRERNALYKTTKEFKS